MTVSITSLEAYRYIERTLGEKQRIVLDCLRQYGPLTNEEVKTVLGWEINCVTGRMNELFKKGLVEASGKILSRKGRSSMRWRAVENSLK